MSEKHCETCICGRRAPVQGTRADRAADGIGRTAGTIAWSEHLEAWSRYAAKYGREQSAERMAERGGFDYRELQDFLGRNPTTWSPR